MATHVATINWGACISTNLIVLATELDSLRDNESAVLTRLAFFDLLDSQEPWGFTDLVAWTATSVLCPEPSLRVVLDEEGKVRFFGPRGKPDSRLQVPDAGVWRKGAKGYGYVQRIRQVGQSLFVCGAHRQVYRYVPGERDPLSGRFVDVAGAMRQPPLPKPPKGSGPAFGAWADAEIVLFNDIAGTDECDVYATGDETWHFDGADWKHIDLGVQDETMHVIKVLAKDRIVIGGSNGYLFMGSAASGFRNVSSVDDNETITGLEWFQDRLYVATEAGLFTWDDQTRRLAPVVTGLEPELLDAHLVESKDGVLWSFGYKDLAYLDAREANPRWVRVHHPDNPRIGALQATPANSSRAAGGTTLPESQDHEQLMRWLPAAGTGRLDLAGLITRVGHAKVGQYVCDQLAPFGLLPGQILQIARMQRYAVSVPGQGLELVLQYAGPRRPAKPPESRPEDWALAEVRIKSGADDSADSWHGDWPAGLQAISGAWQALANDAWGDPGFVGPNGQTHFVPGALGAQFAIKLLRHDPNGPLAEMQVACMGDFIGR